MFTRAIDIDLIGRSVLSNGMLFFIPDSYICCYIWGHLGFFFYLQGFGVVAKSTAECRHADPSTIVAFHQTDIGEYLRSEDTLT